MTITHLLSPVPSGSHLELRRLRLLLPPLPGGAASEGAILAWLLAGAGSGSGGGGSVRLTGVSLVFASQAELSIFTATLCNPDTWTHASVSGTQILDGIVSYSNGSMPLPYGGLAALQDVSVTCSEGGGPQPPYACSATSVHNASDLLAAANHLLELTSGSVMLSLAANISLASPSGDGLAEGWAEGAVALPFGRSLALVGEPWAESDLPSTLLDLAGAVGVFKTGVGQVVMRDLLVVGLAYPSSVSYIKDLYSIWIHAVYNPGYAPVRGREWISLEVLEPVKEFLPEADRRPWGGGEGIVSLSSSAPVALAANWSCGLSGGPSSQTGQRTFWDVRGASRLIVIPPSSPFALSNIVLYNLPPSGPGLAPSDAPPPPPSPPPSLPEPPFTPPGPPEPNAPAGGLPCPAPPVPPAAPGNALDVALAGLSLALWVFDFDRSSSAGLSPLSLRNVTIVVSPAELSLLLGVLREAGRLPPSPGATSVGAPGSRRLAQRGRWLQQGSQPPPPAAALTADDLAAAEAAALSCPRALLSAYARTSDVLSYNDTFVQFSTITFRGWMGTNSATPAAPGDVSLLGASGSSIDGGQPRAGRDAADALDASYLHYLMLRQTDLLNLNASGAEEGQEARPRRIHLAPEGISKRLPAFVPGRGADAWAAAVESVQDEIAAAGGEASGSTGDAASSNRGGTELTLGAILGRGSFGSVYLGMWRGLPVAAKIQVVVDAMLGAEGRRRYRILLEAAIGTSLAHPNLVATYAYDIRPLAVQHGPSTEGRSAPSDEDSILGFGGQVAGPPAPDAYQLITVQELCAGGSLITALESGLAGGSKFCGAVLGDLFAAAAAIHLAADVAAGLRHAHAAGIVHGDISSGNILLAARTGPDADGAAAGGEGEVGMDATEAACRRRLAAATHRPPVAGKVADFGLSVRMGADATHASGYCQGTPLYMAPEVTSIGRISPASDAHAYGVLLLELILGDSARSMWRRQAAAGLGDAWKPRRLLDALPSGGGGCLPRLRALAEACLSQNPADRPTMDQVLERLSEAAEALAAEGVGLAPVSPSGSGEVLPAALAVVGAARRAVTRLDESSFLRGSTGVGTRVTY
ncbi:hypothetical protein HYH03_006098 [Edaphochlamys debaryana]|uniref:Protein kinase domain-containing protein n=1 Tax=Edaphochlamys debaryana TaxID=47281 RepID=A0A835YBJ0_9CHLO|nr:hypothetical protein HYH03_006098 [Edaphochlamys debaryana]|eukprot:KAG2495860.1 hypothetical protein HYH03_006098 [Edaphochlamys debaryana]